MLVTLKVEYNDLLVGAMRITDSLFDIEGVESVEVIEDRSDWF